MKVLVSLVALLAALNVFAGEEIKGFSKASISNKRFNSYVFENSKTNKIVSLHVDKNDFLANQLLMASSMQKQVFVEVGDGFPSYDYDGVEVNFLDSKTVTRVSTLSEESLIKLFE